MTTGTDTGMQHLPEIKLPAGMRATGLRDWRQLGAITAEAFAEDPVNLWIFGNTGPMADVFGSLARSVYLKRGFCHVSGDEGATMWSHSSASREPGPIAMLGLVSSIMRKGTKGAAKRGMTAAETMAREHPSTPHLYLFTIGTRKAARGKGLGKRLLAPVLAAADRDGLPCYLENSNPANTGFYRAHGFERMKMFAAGPGGPSLEAMWREARTG
jgi:ribosomal protein S18 acetylase RimI-like enzyme